MFDWFWRWVERQTEVTRMLYLSDNAHIVVREHINGIWFIMSLSATCVIMWLLIKESYRLRFNWWLMRNSLYFKLAVGMSVYFLGETIMRFWIWLILASNGGTAAWVPGKEIQTDYGIAIFAASLSVLGAICLIRVLTGGNFTWVVCLALWVLFAIADIYII